MEVDDRVSTEQGRETLPSKDVSTLPVRAEAILCGSEICCDGSGASSTAPDAVALGAAAISSAVVGWECRVGV